MNHTEYHGLKSSTILGMFGVLLGCVLVISPAWMGSGAGVELKARVRAESLAYQLFTVHNKNSSFRGPASNSAENEGSIGEDPWGKPYSYKISEEKGVVVVDVWSNGAQAVRTSVRIPKDQL